MLDPVKDRDEVVAARLSAENVALCVDLTDSELLVQRANIGDCADAQYTTLR